jgi:hypothetical protein
MALEFSIKLNTKEFQAGLDEFGSDLQSAFNTAKNMAASMILDQSRTDIASAGRFGSSYLKGLTVKVEGNSIKTQLTSPGASVFQTGGTIHGKPLLWLPISGTDAVGTRAHDYPHKLFSVNRKAGGPPLLFSVADHAPKYFGVPSVHIPKKFHLSEIQLRVMQNFATYFNTALRAK